LCTVYLLAVLFHAAVGSASAFAQDEIDTILKIERGGKGVAEASAAAERLLARGADHDEVLGKAVGAGPVAKNWILSLAEAIADRQPPEVTRKTLEHFLAGTHGDGEARYCPLDYLSRDQPELRDEMLEGRFEDPSLDIRYEAIELALKHIPAVDVAAADEQTKKEAIASYQRLLKAARLPQQINHIAGKLKELGEEADLRTVFGFVSNWQSIGPFDNRNQIGFGTVYPPESQYMASKKLELSHTYTGKSGEATWHAVTTDKPDGKVDLNPAFNNEKGAVVYAYTVVQSGEDVNCQVRIGSANANKVWVNGAEATANDVYHTGSQIDQYVGHVSLKRGANTVLVKVCQNEQTEPWAQDFSFQLRFTDETGLAIPVTQ